MYGVAIVPHRPYSRGRLGPQPYRVLLTADEQKAGSEPVFTGIVQDLCEVLAVDRVAGVGTLTVDLGSLANGLKLGASVATNGTCLTVTAIDGSYVCFEVIGETFRSTNLGSVAVGDRVNIERSLRFGDEIGGHVLSGHVADTVTVQAIESEGDNCTMWFDVEPSHMRYLFWKGFVALDGTSLTISFLDRETNRLAVSLIPETLARTTLGRVEVGQKVNLEIDAQTQAIVGTVQEALRDPEMRTQFLEID